jgi:hypothetical protein
MPQHLRQGKARHFIVSYFSSSLVRFAREERNLRKNIFTDAPQSPRLYQHWQIRRRSLISHKLGRRSEKKSDNKREVTRSANIEVRQLSIGLSNLLDDEAFNFFGKQIPHDFPPRSVKFIINIHGRIR